MSFGKHTEKVEKLQTLIKKMDIPFWRKEIKDNKDLRWLARNIGVRNQKHPDFSEANEIIVEILKIN